MRLVAGVLLSLACVQAASAAEAVWTVAIVGRRDVVLAMRPGQDGMPSADAHLLAPELSFSVSTRSDAVTIRDVNGVEWQTSNGSTRLDGPLESRSLANPVQVLQDAVFLPLDAIAQLAGRKLVLEDRGRAFLMPLPAPVSSRLAGTSRPLSSASATVAAGGGDVRVPNGWQSFDLPKTLDERAAMQRENDDFVGRTDRPTVPHLLPPSHETIGLDLGGGFAQGGGAALDAIGAGTVAGYQVGLAGFITANRNGAIFRSGRVAIESPSSTWTIEAGDLLSEMRGLARGVRLSRRVTSRWRPGVSFYTNDSRVTTDRAAVAYRDSLLLTRNIDLRGEWSSDGSRFAGVRLIAGRGSVETFYRFSQERGVTDRGMSLSYGLWRGISAYGGVRLSNGDQRERWNMIGLAVPVFRGSMFSIEQARTERPSLHDTANAFGLQLPFGPVRIIQRYTWTDVALLEGPSVLGSGRRQLQSMATWSPASPVRFTYQMGTQWYPGRDARQWTELESSLRLSRSTSIHAVTGFPSFQDRERLRVGLQQLLPNAFRLSIDYGHLPAFQTTALLAPEAPRLLVMVRRNWTLHTPAAGADVAGMVRDDSGAPVAGAAVALGRFMTTTGEDGQYRFAHVPAGEHQLEIVGQHLPAAFAVASAPRVLNVTSGTVARADLGVTALRAIHGRVFIDHNANGRMDDNEAVPDVVVRLDGGAATMTNQRGGFDFYNLEPGQYVVWIDTARLRADLKVASKGRLTVNLQPDHAATNVDFTLAVHDKPIVMKVLP